MKIKIGHKSSKISLSNAVHSENNLYFQHISHYGNAYTMGANVFVPTDGYKGLFPLNAKFDMAPSFIVDLSKVDYELVE